jgi:hypothetical protein
VKHTKVKSGSVAAFLDMSIEATVKAVDDLGLNAVVVPVDIDIASATTHEMSVNQAHKAKMIELIIELRKRNVEIILEPYPLIAEGTIPETDYNPTDVNGFFWNWKTIALQELIEDIAIPYQVEALFIASNFVHLEQYTEYWQLTVNDVRSKYTGEITYRTNWWITATWAPETITAYEEKLNNPIFGMVDFISIAAYFELSEKNSPTTSDLIADLRSSSKFGRNQNIYQEVKRFHEVWGKPVFFGELGFTSYELTTSEPWNTNPSTVESEVIQNSAYTAYKEVFADEPWFMGFSIYSIGMPSSNYSVIDKLAEITIRDWWKEASIVLPPPTVEVEASTVLEYRVRPSMIKTNARYRGPSELGKYSNYVNETMHDILLLSRKIDGNKGHADQITNNFASYFSGDNKPMTSNEGTTVLLQEQGKEFTSAELDSTDWVPYGDCSVTKTESGYVLKSNGTSDPSGIYKEVQVSEGQMIYIRMKVKRKSGSANDFRIGSLNVNEQEGSIMKFAVTGTEKYIGHSFLCRQKETIQLNIEVQGNSTLVQSGEVEITDCTITLIEVDEYKLQPTNTYLKSTINSIEENIKHIINNL